MDEPPPSHERLNDPARPGIHQTHEGRQLCGEHLLGDPMQMGMLLEAEGTSKEVGTAERRETGRFERARCCRRQPAHTIAVGGANVPNGIR